MATLVIEKDQIEEIVARLETESSLVLDFVAFSPSGQESKIMGLSIAPLSERDIYYVPFIHSNPFETNELLIWGYVLPHICPLIDGKKIVGHDLVNISTLIKSAGGNSRIAYGADIMVEAYVMGKFAKVDLVSLVRTIYGVALEVKYPAILAQNDANLPMSIFFNYACERVEYIRKIHRELYPQITSNQKLKRIYQIEMDVLPIAAEMQENGINVDFEKCESEAIRLMKEADTLSEALHGWLSRNFQIETHFDFGSSAQTAALIIDRLHIADEVKTARGNRSTSKKNYEGLRDSSPLIDGIFTIRELIKVATAFYKVYPKYRHPDNRLHPRLLTAHVISGRTASKDPNIQQIPRESIWEFVDFDDPESDRCTKCESGDCEECRVAKKKKLRTAVREVFLPRSGFLFVEADYAMIELMVMAGISGESEMLKAFRQDVDIHAQTAALIYDVPLEEVTKDQRQVGKAANFRFIYGGGAEGLASRLGLPVLKAKQIYSAYMRGYKQLAHYSLLAANEAGRKGYIETLFGRRRYMDEFRGKDSKSRARARRLAVNLEVQGTAADIGKIALIRQEKARHRFDQEHQYKTYLSNFIHDSFLWEIPIISSEETKQCEFIREFISVTREALIFDVRALTGIKDFPELKLDFKIGVNYQEMIEEVRWLQVAEDGEYLGLPKMEYDEVKKAKQMEQHKGGEHVDSSDGHFVENISGE